MKIPVQLNALRAFEVTARHLSFSVAAEELHVTPAAVGQMVRGLEEWLGAPLFHRSAGGKSRLTLTDVAQRALPDLQAGFERLGNGLEKLREASASGVLTVTVSPAFAAKWLLPRIDRFQARWPDTDIRLDTSLKLVDFFTQDIDVGVRYGAGSWPALVAEKLSDEEIFPVCSPVLLRPGKKLRKLEDLAQETLIHDLSMVNTPGFASWKQWLEAAKVTDVSGKRNLRINNSASVLQAAIDGHGVALARSVMAKDDLASGRLIRLFPSIEFPTSLAYYLVYRPEKAHLPRLVAFREWILAEHLER